MARADFIKQLEALGYRVEDKGENRLSFRYKVPVGKMIDQELLMGLLVGDDFPANPPTGPHISPRIYPNQGGGQHPTGGIHNSPFGNDWHYWSRPFNGWKETDRSARAYMAHVRHLFDTL
jgi:hypothetical protein